MTADKLIQYLQQPDGLRRVSYQELKTLALEHPFCPHVHQLLVFKSRLDGHKDFPADLARAAARHVDRAFLRKRFIEIDAGMQGLEAPLHEEFFELKPLAELEQRLAAAREPVPVEAMPAPAPKREAPFVPAEKLPPVEEVKVPIEEVEEALAGIADKTPGQSDTAAPEQPPPIEEIPEVQAQASEPVPGEPSGIVEMPMPEPMSKSGFRSWNRSHALRLKQVALPPMPLAESPSVEVEMPAAQEPELAYNLPDLRGMAERSVKEKEEVASETLADLLARQGHVAKALEMYERLCLLFPEKKATFAARIENLKNN